MTHLLYNIIIIIIIIIIDFIYTRSYFEQVFFSS